MSSLGDRMKRYERSWCDVLPPNSWVVVRVDGRSFHTWTRGANRPFDHDIHAAMTEATRRVAADIAGFRLAYTQSDEATFVFTDTADFESELWFGGKVAKIVSIAAAAFTAWFNDALGDRPWRSGPAMFDGRVFTMPEQDTPNAVLWRQRDWERNSLQMLARSHFSHRELHEKNTADVHEMLHRIGVNWANLPAVWKNGTTLYGPAGVASTHERHTWESLCVLAGIAPA